MNSNEELEQTMEKEFIKKKWIIWIFFNLFFYVLNFLIYWWLKIFGV